MTEPILVPISPGELIDKITILEIKSRRMTDAEKLANVGRELELLNGARAEQVDHSQEIARMTDELREINTALWDIEDDIRRCEAEGDFGSRFIELARSVYRTNDERARVKREINISTGSGIVEEKDYQSYAQSSP